MKAKKLLSLGLMATMAFSMFSFAGCGGKSAGGGGDTEFSWWIFSTDGNGVYYEDYEDNPAVQWLNAQYWDVENGGLGTEENGTNVKFSFQVPITGAEQDNFNTMMSTEQYTDIIDLAVSSDSSSTLVNEGVLMDITEYVEKYMPNYVAYLEENPEQKALVTHTDEDGKLHYYEIARIKEENDVPWGGYVYRRDWIVEYATPSAYVWDWDSDYVKENGHPAVTPLSEAQKAGNLEGWKANDVTEFKVLNDGGDDPDNLYEDNVIFPSGKTDPYTISDWEWMMEAFQKAIDDKGFAGNSDSYCISLYYPGYTATGDLVSTFGGGSGIWSKDADQNVYFSGTTDNFKTYLECMNSWNSKGWLDTKFETRASDIFFSINQNGTAQGMVGMWYGMLSSLGDAIRVSCTDPQDQQNAYVMACSVPVNDMYGSDEQKFYEPDAFYQSSRISGRIGVTTAAKDKDLAALFTCLDWMYTREGALVVSLGLSEEQLNATEIENNLYEEYKIEGGAYDVTKDENGNDVYTIHYDISGDMSNALKLARMLAGIELTGAGADLDYSLVRGDSEVVTHAYGQWTAYTSTASMMDYNNQLTEDENETYTAINQKVTDYMAQNVPALIKNGLSGWDDYVKGLEDLKIDEVTEIYKGVVEELFG